jgi:hypothetical protein
MNRFARMLFVGLGIVGAGTAMSLVPHKAATAGSLTPVTVTNSSLAVTQSGAWNVGITGTPSVHADITNQVPVTGTVNANVSFPSNQQVTLTPTSIMNLGKLPSQQVVLGAGILFTSCPGWTDSNTNQCFSGVPNGSVLVITDVDWTAGTKLSSPSLSDHGCELEIFGAGLLFSSYATSDADGVIGKNEHIAGGLYFNPAVQGSQAPSWNLTAQCQGGDVVLRGYLTPNQ